MEKGNKEEIRGAVRNIYGEIARTGADISDTNRQTDCCGTNRVSHGPTQPASCCTPQEAGALSGLETCGCGPSDFSSEKWSQHIGYSKEDLETVPQGSNMGLGCGNPVALASLKAGETVVDLGSGGGFDCFLAARQVGDTGKVIGVDMTPDMIDIARKNAENIETRNVEFRLGEIEHLPVADNSADIIMSNCVINLSPDKGNVYREAYRVLKPGGRLAISDVLASAPLPDEVRNDLALVGACVGGAATAGDTENMLRETGFRDIRIQPNDKTRKLREELDPKKMKNALDYVFSAYIEAVKPTE